MQIRIKPSNFEKCFPVTCLAACCDYCISVNKQTKKNKSRFLGATIVRSKKDMLQLMPYTQFTSL